MKEIKLTQGYVAFVDDEDFERVSRFKWQVLKVGKMKYAQMGIWNKKTKKNDMITIHRFLLCLVKNDGFVVDHIDGNGLNNIRDNLRTCNNAENTRNRHDKKPKGVFFKKDHFRIKPWKAGICFNNKHINLGYFKTEKEGQKVYKEASIFYFKEFSPFYERKKVDGK